MTYNQILNEIQTLLESHLMIKTAKNTPINDWLNKTSQPEYPACIYNIVNGSLNKGLSQNYAVQFFFLDKAGADREFEEEVTSDQIQIASDIVSLLRGFKRTYSIDDNITYNIIADKYEDYLAGVELTINFETQGSYDGCDSPIF
jgi:hypothetical protein